jgi:hypothetical protein
LRECENTLEFFSSAVFGFEFTKESARFWSLKVVVKLAPLLYYKSLESYQLMNSQKHPQKRRGRDRIKTTLLHRKKMKSRG